MTLDSSSGNITAGVYSLTGLGGTEVPTLAGTTSKYFLYQVGYSNGGAYMSVLLRKGFSQVYQSVGFLDFGVLQMGDLQEVLFMTVTTSDPVSKTALVRVFLQIDPNTGELLQKKESILPLKDNCAKVLKTTRYLAFVSCPASGIVETFRTDTMEKIDAFKISTFSEEWAILRTLNDV